MRQLFEQFKLVDMLKKKFSSLRIGQADERIVLSGASGRADAYLTREQFVTVIVDRLYEILDEVARDLEKNNLLDGIDEVILTGGTARFDGITELCKKRFGKPVSVGVPWFDNGDMMAEINVPEFVTAYGLASYYFTEDEIANPFHTGSSGGGGIRDLFGNFLDIFKRG